jgi:hypothetical protein
VLPYRSQTEWEWILTYDQRFFDGIRAGIKRSAESLVPLLVSELAPAIDVKSVIDVGCGEGWWGREFAFWDFVPVGMDKWTDTEVVSMIDHDLEQPLGEAFPEGTINRFGLALCLEVAEHLTPERGPSFIADLCKLSDLIVFSAAIPGQRGVNHLSEAWPAHWVSLFRDNGFAVSGAMRWMIWEDEEIEPWYRQNLLIATKHPERLPNLFDTPLAYPWPVVHPAKWAEVTGAPKP